MRHALELISYKIHRTANSNDRLSSYISTTHDFLFIFWNYLISPHIYALLLVAGPC